MTSIIEKYFSDQPSKDDLIENNLFHSPADLKEIEKIENVFKVKLPKDYVDFLLTTNGFEGKIGESYANFTSVEKIEELTKAYGGEFFPWIIFIGTDYGNEMFVIDKRKEKLKFGILPYIGDESDFIELGNSFEEFINRLYSNNYWV